ncbi:MAG TPA: PAS domain-containing protein, partial [Methanosarcina sp.]|nr:PAS domain-containing protein [Methanosarcina sp.]
MVEKHKALGRIISEQSDEIFRHEKVKLILRVLIASAIVMFCVETVIMLFLESVWNVPEPYDFLVDGLILIIILFPLNYYFIVRPMSDEIDRHHKTNKELINSYQTLERFFSIEDVLIAHMDSRFNFIRVNKAYAEADEHNPDYYIGKNHFSLFPNEENKAIFEMVVRTGKGFNINDKPFLYAGHPERGITYWDWNLIPIKDTAGQVVQMLFVLNNVTGRKKAQIALSESER